MPLTVNLTQLKRKKKKDNTIPIYIRITEDRKSRYKSTGVFVLPKDWNSNKKVIRNSHNRADHLNWLLRKKLREVQEKRDDLQKKDALSLDRLKQSVSSNSDPHNLITRAKRYHDSLDNTDRYWEWKRFGVLLNNLKKFVGKKTKQVADVDAQFIEGFQDYLLEEVGNNPNTVRRKLTSFKGMFLKLIRNKEIKNDPFTAVNKVSKEPANRVKLSLRQIKAIEDLTLKRGSKLWHVRNYFLYSFYNAGIRFGDLCSLTWGNLIDGRLSYEMHKTGGKKSIKQLSPMYRILFQYVEEPGNHLTFKNRDLNSAYFLSKSINTVNVFKCVIKKYAKNHSTEFIFPILDHKYNNPFQLRKAIGSNNAQVNKLLKDLAELADIDANISFHVSRHSFANYANKQGMDLYSISKALAHSDLKTTQQYLKSFDEEKLDSDMEKIF